VVVLAVSAPVSLIATPTSVAPLTVPNMLKVEVVAVAEVADDVALSHGEVFATPKVPHPEPHPERRTATKNGKAVRIDFMCRRTISISLPLVYVLMNGMLPYVRQYCCAASLEIIGNKHLSKAIKFCLRTHCQRYYADLVIQNKNARNISADFCTRLA
jgi:hypothetical protein